MARLNVIFVSDLLHEDGRDLPDILEAFVACGNAPSVQSMLLFSGGNLMQVIDGEEAHTKSELQRLFHCPHYLNSIVLNEEQVQVPSLSGSSLGGKGLAADVIEKLPGNVAFFSLSERAVAERIRTGVARNLLTQFAADYA